MVWRCAERGAGYAMFVYFLNMNEVDIEWFMIFGGRGGTISR